MENKTDTENLFIHYFYCRALVEVKVDSSTYADDNISLKNKSLAC